MHIRHRHVRSINTTVTENNIGKEEKEKPRRRQCLYCHQNEE
jgi:hypothetical protein